MNRSNEMILNDVKGHFFVKKSITTLLLLLALVSSVSATVPAAPELSVSVSGLSLTISWTAASDADAYTLYYAPNPYTGPETIGNISMLTERTLSADLQVGDSYYLAVTAYNDEGESEYSNLGSFTIGAESETQIFTLSSEAIANGELLEEFKCERKTNDIEDSIPVAWSNVPAGTVSLGITMHHFPNPDDANREDALLKANSYFTLWDIDPTVTEIAHGEANNGEWHIGSNKDGTAISYTSPCSPFVGSNDYVLTLYALSAIPQSLPTSDSIDISYAEFIEAITTVEVLETAVLKFADVNQ
jgi:hypothetical protein